MGVWALEREVGVVFKGQKRRNLVLKELFCILTMVVGA